MSPKKKFVYQNDHEHIRIEAAGLDTIEVAAEVGNLCREIYSGLHRSNPEAAEEFKLMAIMAIAHPDSPVWTVREQSEDAYTVCIGLG